ncbi:MAG: LytTR family transcriptional regulator [Eubacterium sp.]|jgi:Response regulator of the LytR/AlgR family|nr:LytTR family transcriptional regulator [Eubacterium sp.]
MTWSNESQIDTELNDTISYFLEQYGASGLKQALQLYKDTQQEYICRTRTSISKLYISDIYYMEIREHQITIYTQHGTYHKYGTLNTELKSLSPYGFIKCAQNRIVSLNKIRTINYTDITLINGTKIHMSKRYALATITAFSR